MDVNLVGTPQLCLMGHPRLIDAQGQRVELTSKKSVAVLGLLALAKDGVRSRAWLQQKLWGSRDVKQAQNSLRRELANMRNTLDCLPLITDHRSIRLDLDAIWIDVLQGAERGNSIDEEFLEGLDIAGEDDFEEWLRDARSQIAAAGTMEVPGEDVLDGPGPNSPEYDDIRGISGPTRGSPVSKGSASRHKTSIAITIIGDPANVRREDASLLHLIRQELGAGLSRLGWLPVIAAPDGATARRGAALANIQDEARFTLTLSLIPVGPAPLLSINCVEMPMQAIIWNETAPLSLPLQQKDLHLRMGRTINALENAILAASRAGLRSPETIDDGGDAIEALRYLLPRIHNCTGLGLADRLLRIAETATSDYPDFDIFRAVHAVRTHWWRPQRGSLNTARKLTEVALARRPADIRAIMAVAIIQKWSGNFEPAKRLFERIISANPACVAAYANFGAVCLLQGDNSKAMSLLRTAEALSPFDPEIFWIYGQMATAALMADRHDEALRYAEDSMALQSRYILPALVAAHCYQLRGDTKAARKALEGCGITPASPMANHALTMMPFNDPGATGKLRSGLAALI